MKILYVARAFPPRVGGLETAAYELYRALDDIAEVSLDAKGWPNKYLPFAFVYLLVRGLWLGLRHRPDGMYLQDGVLAPLGVILKFFLRRPVVMSVHGLDVTYKSGLYQRIARFSFPRIDRIVVGSGQTMAELEARFPGLNPARVTYGVRDNFYAASDRQSFRQQLAQELGVDAKALQDKTVLVTTGRLVTRKGVAWFVDNVMPKLTKRADVLYLVAGNGPDKERIESLVSEHKLDSSVRLLGYISDDMRNLLYNAADFFVMPNIPVPGDMEGFGLVALEAASCGTPVIASGIEGIVDAVADGKTGLQLRASDAEQYVKTIEHESNKPSLNRADVRQYVLDTFSWEKAAVAYLDIFAAVQKH